MVRNGRNGLYGQNWPKIGQLLVRKLSENGQNWAKMVQKYCQKRSKGGQKMVKN
jgi:hypothetical protein